MKVLVTGGLGFLGTAVVQCLLRENHVQPLERLQGRERYLKPGVDILSSLGILSNH